MDKAIGMLGLGIMGSAISKNLLDVGFKVVGYDLLPEGLAKEDTASVCSVLEKMAGYTRPKKDHP